MPVFIAAVIWFVTATVALLAVALAQHFQEDRIQAVSEWTANNSPTTSPPNEPELPRTVLKRIQEPFPTTDRATIRESLQRNLRIFPFGHIATVASILSWIAAAAAMSIAIWCIVRCRPIRE